MSQPEPTAQTQTGSEPVKPKEVIWLNDDFQPCAKKFATRAKLKFDNGAIVFAVIEKKEAPQ